MKIDPEFAEQQKLAREHSIEAIEAAMDAIAAAEENPSVPAATLRLKALRPEVYRERHEIMLTKAEREARVAELLSRRSSMPPVPTLLEETNGHPNGVADAND